MKKIIIGICAIFAVVTIFAFTSQSSTSSYIPAPAPEYTGMRIDWTDNYTYNYADQGQDYYQFEFRRNGGSWKTLDCFSDGEYESFGEKIYYSPDALIY